ncbi:histamine H3 receptor [Xenopus tropicalis]|uniref:Histamine H3 receptor n=1 Tax=Xenopus tropicalis TaxID=8364 RepID=A0A6I8ST80_XENTR|nr:histamine H3 receptor [Xenopus tropicalis]
MQIYRLGNDSGINLTLDTAGSTTQFSDAVNILIIALISLLILLTVGGNTLVILAFFVEKRLRNQSNFFLLNLSIADFILGTFAIPLYVPYLLTGKWLLGKFLCKLWLIVDYTMCTASAFNVALISWDRFLSVTQAVLYRSQQNRPCRTVIKMAAVWILSFLLYGPAIIFWDFVPSTEEIPENICVAGFYYTWYYLLTASAFDFVLPLISISFFNLSIYCNIKKRSRRKMQNSISLPPQKSRKEAKLCTIATNITLQSPQIDIQKKSFRRRINISCNQCFGIKSSSHNNKRSDRENNQVSDLSRDKKVAKSLSVLVCIFAICWAPYSFLMSIRAACHGYCIHIYWYDITFWLLWTNSAINPIIYPLCHKGFQKAFLNIVKYVCMKKTNDSA